MGEESNKPVHTSVPEASFLSKLAAALGLLLTLLASLALLVIMPPIAALGYVKDRLLGVNPSAPGAKSELEDEE